MREAETRPTVFVDTNVWISGFINPFGAPGRVLDAFRQGRFVPVVSGALLGEIREVLARPRIYRRWQIRGGDVDNTLSLLEDRAIHVFPIGDLHLCRDPDDDVLLETALVGGAAYFVSRDDDLKRDQELMVLLEARGVKVLSVAQFLDFLANLSKEAL